MVQKNVLALYCYDYNDGVFFGQLRGNRAAERSRQRSCTEDSVTTNEESMKPIVELDRVTAQQLFNHYRQQRDGIRDNPEMASICLICGSVHVGPKNGETGMLVCRNCGFSWYRYECTACGKTVDGRDPLNPACRVCSWRICTCGTCSCPSVGRPAGSIGRIS